ncbi:MAG: hypothetical protein JWL86_3813 [Rhizobium sp.]|nr:hypothetical protein [Rhizobium sp.]
MPPTWVLASTDIPANLVATKQMYENLLESIQNRDRFFIVYGQSGSGKTTAILQCLNRYLKETQDSFVYELAGDTPSLRAALSLLRKIHKDQHVIIYIGDAFVYGDALAEDILGFPQGAFTLISSARSGEWRHHIDRRVGDFSTSFKYERFAESDHKVLIDRILTYVPAPRFHRLTPQKRIEKFKNSKSQLLIALREVTESQKFSDIITSEYNSLPDDDCRRLALIVGLCTLARTGITDSMAKEAYNRERNERTFEGAKRGLEGIISRDSNGRLVARHELYVRHIIENVATFAQVVDCIVDLLSSFTKYELPVVKNVLRPDSLLFKFLLNHTFVSEIARRRGDLDEALRIYSTFEIDFQLDGHFWLQYGLYQVERHDLEAGLNALSKSIQAYPGNTFAIHAYADTQLRVAHARKDYDATTVQLIGDALEVLEELHSKKVLNTDQYPIVTLSEHYIGALIKHGQLKVARSAAQRYFRDLDNIVKRGADEPVQHAREKLARFITLGVWQDPRLERTKSRRHRSRSKQSKKSILHK